ncbi:MAG: hypothetical protein ABL959_15660 [Pyrinomonadaceae bacterium]
MAEIEPNTIASTTVVEIVETPMWNTLPPNRPRKVYGGMWGPVEIGAVGVGALALIATAVVYIFFVIPSNRELVKNRSEADRLETELIAARTKYGDITNTETEVAKIVSSVDDFEMRFLPVVSTGQSALYQRINSLISAYGLVNTSGPDYAPLETADRNAGAQSDEQKGRAKFRSLYPGVYVSTTVEGSYQSLRRFIREIETGREFIIVSAVELAPSEGETEKTSQPQVAGNQSGIPTDDYGAADPTRAGQNKGMPPGFNPNQVQLSQQQPRERAKGKMHGDIVSLRIEMAAYFRRPNFSPVTPVQ